MTPHLLARIERAHAKAAEIVVIDPRALPIFERLDRELAAAKVALDAQRAADPVERARALLAAERMKTDARL